MRDSRFRAALLSAAILSPALGAAPAFAQAPGGGSFPGSILLPGTNTSFKTGGYAKLDFTYDFSATQNVIGGIVVSAIPLDANVPGGAAANPATIAGHSIHGVSQLTASESRFNFESRTPTAYGEMKTFIEGDFTNPSGLTNGKTFKVNSDSSGFRLRHAYGTLGPLLAGQTYSLFRDAASEGETLDFGGPIVAGASRQPQIRYTFDAGDGLTIAGSLENPETQAVTQAVAGGAPVTTTSFGSGQGQKIPDFAAAARWVQPWGHVAFRALLRDLYDHSGTNAAGNNISQSEFGWGLGLSGTLKTWGKDVLLFQANGGDGIGRYSNDNGLVADVVVDLNNNAMRNLKIYDGEIGYQHWWTDQLRSNVNGSYMHIGYPTSGPAALPAATLAVQNTELVATYANLIWSPVPQVDLGVEYTWQERKVASGQHGFLNRVQMSSKFKF